MWNTKSGQLIHKMKGHTDIVFSCALSLDESMIVSGSFDKTVRVWDTKTGKLIKILQGHTSAVNAVATVKLCVDITKDWPLTHHLVPSHLCLTICEILCLSRNVLPKDLQIYLVRTILQVGL